MSLTLRPIKQCAMLMDLKEITWQLKEITANQHKISIYQNPRTVIIAAWIIRLSIYKSLIFIFCERFYIKIWKLVFGSKISIIVVSILLGQFSGVVIITTLHWPVWLSDSSTWLLTVTPCYLQSDPSTLHPQKPF